MANAFCNFLTTITEKFNMQQIQKGDAISILKDSFPLNFPRIKIIPITDAEIKSIMHSLKPKKSSGCDEKTTKILKACASLISHPLRYIYYHLLYTSIFPDCLKSAVVKPVHKKGDKTSMTNYRHVSLLAVFCKVLEKAMHCRLTFRHCASSIQDRHFTTLQRTLFIYLINKYISLTDICLTVRH